MSPTEILLDYYELRIQRLLLEAYDAGRGTAQREAESPQRIALCQARKVDQLQRARDAGILEVDLHQAGDVAEENTP